MVKAKLALFGQIWAQRQTHNGAQFCTIPPNRAQPGPNHRRQSMPHRPQHLGNAIPVVQSPLWGAAAYCKRQWLAIARPRSIAAVCGILELTMPVPTPGREGAAPSLVLQQLSAGVPPAGELHGI